MEPLDGKGLAQKIQARLKNEILDLKTRTGRVPGLAVVLVGDDPASRTYVKSKEKAAAELGIFSRVVRLGTDVGREELIAGIEELNRAEEISGVLVQLPLPKKFPVWDILDHLDPAKDVDCFHPFNLGMVLLNRAHLFPCTPAGVLELLDHHKIDVTGMNAAVVGRSFIVGKPLLSMLSNRDATVTLCHSKTRDLGRVVERADLVVAAVGRPAVITADMVKDGAVLIDVGTNYLDKREDVRRYCDESQQEKFEKKGYAYAGDIHYPAYHKASFYTPVPGGVGPMTVAMLMHNTVELFKKRLSPGK